jgi:hypothetical protein
MQGVTERAARALQSVDELWGDFDWSEVPADDWGRFLFQAVVMARAFRLNSDDVLDDNPVPPADINKFNSIIDAALKAFDEVATA